MTLPATQQATIAVTGAGLKITTLDEAWRLATAIVKSGMAPKDFGTPEKVLIAMQHGWEIGLSPMQSLQSIAVINNRPALWGDSLPALVHASGKCQYVKEWMEGEGDMLTAHCESKRRDQDKAITSSFSVSDAKKANLWGKGGPWSNYPKRMLKLRARAFNFRDNFADALRGLAVAEEVMDYEPKAPTAASTIPAGEYHDELLDSVSEPKAIAAKVEVEGSVMTPDEIEAIRQQEAEETKDVLY